MGWWEKQNPLRSTLVNGRGTLSCLLASMSIGVANWLGGLSGRRARGTYRAEESMPCHLPRLRRTKQPEWEGTSDQSGISLGGEMKTKRVNSYLLYALTAFSLLNFACDTANNQAIVLPVPPPTAQEHQRLQPSSPQTPRPDQAPRAPAALVIEEQAGISYYETVLTIPVGEAGVAYRGVDIPGMEVTGPNALAILSDGSIVVADLIGNRLLRYDLKGRLLEIIDLYAKEIVNMWDLVAFKDELILLEISLDISPERYRVNRLTSNGELLTSYDLPKGYRLPDGLTGISVDCEG